MATVYVYTNNMCQPHWNGAKMKNKTKNNDFYVDIQYRYMLWWRVIAVVTTVVATAAAADTQNAQHE